MKTTAFAILAAAILAASPAEARGFHLHLHAQGLHLPNISKGYVPQVHRSRSYMTPRPILGPRTSGVIA